jgi:hypothetical protein
MSHWFSDTGVNLFLSVYHCSKFQGKLAQIEGQIQVSMGLITGGPHPHFIIGTTAPHFNVVLIFCYALQDMFSLLSLYFQKIFVVRLR